MPEIGGCGRLCDQFAAEFFRLGVVGKCLLGCESVAHRCRGEAVVDGGEFLVSVVGEEVASIHRLQLCQAAGVGHELIGDEHLLGSSVSAAVLG